MTDFFHDVNEPIGEIEVEPPQYKHDWLYSVIPATVNENNEIYLTGYCRRCDNYFTKQLEREITNEVIIERANVPKFGCVGPEGV